MSKNPASWCCSSLMSFSSLQKTSDVVRRRRRWSLPQFWVERTCTRPQIRYYPNNASNKSGRLPSPPSPPFKWETQEGEPPLHPRSRASPCMEPSPPLLPDIADLMAEDATGDSRLRSSGDGEGSSLEDPDIIEISPSRYQKQKRKRIHQEALPYTSIGMSTYFASKNGAAQIILSNSEPIPKRLCKNEWGMIVEDEIDMRFRSFKQFDIVQDHSDHAFNEKERIPPTKNLIKRIHYEWKILKEALPETIYVRAYEGRMDLLSVVIIGAAGTPYHDGLFFFDIYFHPKYPKSAPYVKYHSIGLNLNPHIGSAGNVCLSLLSRFGRGCEVWCPSKSTILQVLVSLQGLVLTANPLLNYSIGNSAFGEPQLPNSDEQMRSRAFNERYFLASCRTMLYTLRKPPKNFEDLISGHFCKCGRAVLTACLAYLDGAQVGCVDEDDIQNVDKVDSSSSSDFRMLLGCMICNMMREFSAKGADCNDLTQKVNAISVAAAVTTRAKKSNKYLDENFAEEENLKAAIDGLPMYKVPPLRWDLSTILKGTTEVRQH